MSSGEIFVTFAIPAAGVVLASIAMPLDARSAKRAHARGA